MSTSGFGESPSATQGQNEESRRVINVVPISVRSIIKGIQADDLLWLGKEKVGMVVVVGLITSVVVESTVVTIKVDDTTGPPLVVKQWLDQQGRPQKDTSELMKPLVENCYVKVTGSVRTNNGEVYVVAHNISSLSHLNELTSHLLEMAVTKKLFETGIKPSENFGRTGTGMQQGTGLANQSNFSAGSGYGLNGTSKPFRGGTETVSGLTPQQQMVFQTIRAYDDVNGCSMEFLMSHVKGMSQDAIRKAVALLSEEGHIYSTVDDDHYKATDN